MCTDLLQDTGAALAVGIVLVVILPLLFAAFVTYFILVYLYGKQARAAAFILAEDPAEVRDTLSASLASAELEFAGFWSNNMSA